MNKDVKVTPKITNARGERKHVATNVKNGLMVGSVLEIPRTFLKTATEYSQKRHYCGNNQKSFLDDYF